MTEQEDSRADGWSKERVERTLFARWTRGGDDLPPPETAVLARALVLMRRTGLDHYGPPVRRALARAEGPVRCPVAFARAARLALPPGRTVALLGEPHSGTVTHVVVCLAHEDPYPAPWYVVACAPLGVCRAHGADEIEPVCPER
ncbi:hypothetical protein [Streptomyces murinus]|uniref:hypothetical protein n=2 Tax=Streptomyces TaxID=1883 RepID=UPI00382F0898